MSKTWIAIERSGKGGIYPSYIFVNDKKIPYQRNAKRVNCSSGWAARMDLMEWLSNIRETNKESQELKEQAYGFMSKDKKVGGIWVSGDEAEIVNSILIKDNVQESFGEFIEINK